MDAQGGLNGLVNHLDGDMTWYGVISLSMGMAFEIPLINSEVRSTAL